MAVISTLSGRRAKGRRGSVFAALLPSHHGYSLPDAVRRRCDANSPQPALLPGQMRAEAKRSWQSRSFYRLLNRMLFRAARPHLRYRVLEHFYRLDPDLIARFYAGRSTLRDKIRIVSGKPPVPVGQALRSLWT